MNRLHKDLNSVFHKGDLFLASIFSNDLPGYIENKKVLLSYIDFYKRDIREGNFGEFKTEKILYLLSEMESVIHAMEHSGFPPPEVIQDDFLTINEQVYGIAVRTMESSKQKAWMESFAILFFLIGLGILNYRVWTRKASLEVGTNGKLSLG